MQQTGSTSYWQKNVAVYSQEELGNEMARWFSWMCILPEIAGTVEVMVHLQWGTEGNGYHSVYIDLNKQKE